MPGAQGAQVAFGGLGFGGTVCDLFRPGAIWVREQLPAGWGDTYVQAVAGQAFDITNVPNGNYRIAVRVNPLGVLHETSTADDVVFRRIRLSGRRGARRVEVAPWHGING
jgi:Lysyl oxidase